VIVFISPKNQTINQYICSQKNSKRQRKLTFTRWARRKSSN